MTASPGTLPPALRTTQVNIPEGTIDLGVGQPSLSLLPLEAVRTAAEHRFSQNNREFLAYGADEGDGYFRTALASFLTRRYATPVGYDSLMTTASASQALDLLCTQFTKPGDTIFVEEPTYFLALLTFRDHGLNVVGVPLDRDGIRVDKLAALLEEHRPVFLYTVPTFQNPSGITLTADRREQLVALSVQHNFLIVADEVYHLLDFGNTPPPPMAAHTASEHVVSLGSFSKIAAPGLRLGWIHTAPRLTHSLVNAGMIESGGGLNPFTSGIMRSMLELGLQDTCLDGLRLVFRERSAALCDALHEYMPASTFVAPEGGFFVWLRLPEGKSSRHITERRAEFGVNVQPGERFGNRPELSQWVRLSFAYYDKAELREGVQRLARAVRGLDQTAHERRLNCRTF